MNRGCLALGDAARKDAIETLISEEAIAERVRAIGAEIAADYCGKSPLFVGVLKGVLFFMADLLRQVPASVEVDFMAVSSYSSAERDRGFVRLIKDLDTPITGRHVLFVEDIVDTGLTLNYLLGSLRARGPASLDVCAFFNKPARRLIEIPLRYKGFDLPDRFVVGYGLDYRERYRNLPYVGVLDREAMSRGPRE